MTMAGMNNERQPDLPLRSVAENPATLTVTFDLAQGAILFSWTSGDGAEFARGSLRPNELSLPFFVLHWSLEMSGYSGKDSCNAWPASTRALLKRIRKQVPDAAVT